MVLGLKPMGKPTTKNAKFWTKPRYCMVLRLKLMGKPTTYKKLSKTKFWIEGIAWSLNSNLWGNQLLKRDLSFRQN